MKEERTVAPEWLSAPETRAVLAPLVEAGHAVRFVGGCVRDTLLGRAVGDIDIATDAVPDAVMAALRRAGIRAIPTGIDHGTITAVAGGKPFEITTLRHDVETDGRRATVRFTDDWEADAARRDLTINAMSLDPDGRVHDPFGGRADLKAGRIRFVGDPRDRIEEDVLRLLRYFRFYAHYGRPPPDPSALDACRALASRLPNLSGERVRAELVKLLTAADPLPALALMRDTRALDYVLPEAGALPRLERLVRIEAQAGLEISPIRRLAALLTLDGTNVDATAARLRLSNAERDYLATAASETVAANLSDKALRRQVHRLGPKAFRELAILAWADAADDAGWRACIDFAMRWNPRRLPITGADVLQRGIPRGPAVGELLTAVEEWWIDGGFSADRQTCLDRLDKEIAERV